MYNYYANADERIWVQSRQAADAYLVAPGGFVRLWDSNTNRYYERRSDATGRPLPTEVYEYKRVEDTHTCCGGDERIKALEERIAKLERGISYEQSNTDDTAV